MNKLLLVSLLIGMPFGDKIIHAAEQNTPDSTLKYYLLDEAFVYVDRTFLPIMISDYGLPVTLLSIRDAEAAHIHNAYELLSRIPGVNYQRSRLLVHGMGPNFKGSYRMRGIGAKPGAGLRIMVDGRPQYMGFWGHPILDNHPIDDIERVEAGGQFRHVEWFGPGPIDDPRINGDATNGGEFSAFGIDLSLHNTFQSSNGQIVLYADNLDNEQYLDSKNISNNLGLRAWQTWEDVWEGAEVRLGLDYES